MKLCVANTVAHLFFHLVNDFGLGRRVVDEDWQQVQWTAGDVDVDGAWCDMSTDVFQHDSALRQRQAASQQVTGVEQIRQNTITSIVQLAVRVRSFVGCPSAKYPRTTKQIHYEIHFYRAAWNADGSSDESSVCPSVCPSITRVHCDKTVDRSVQIFIPYERTFSLVF